jgi:argininosuccinate synthase
LKRIVLGFSGDAESSAAIPWLLETARAEVVSLTLDVGPGRDPAETRDKALALGAVRAHVIDVRESFATDCVVPALRAGKLADAGPATVATLALPLLARQLVEIAHLERATVVAHACTGPDRDAIESLIRALDANLAILACPGDRVRQDAVADAENGLSLEAPDTPASVDLAFENGTPVDISGVPMNVAELIQCLDTIAGGHGVGRTRVNGVPALVALHTAHQALQETAASGEPVSGLVRLELFKGDCRVSGRHAMA